MELACQSGQAALIEPAELGAVGLPPTYLAVDVVERMPDLVTHHVGRRREARTDDDLPVAVGTGAGTPCRPPGRQQQALELSHGVEVGNTADADVDRVQTGDELLLNQLRQLGKPVD